jgi:hypothetical protein
MAHPNEIMELGKLTFVIVLVLLFLTWTTVALRMWVRIGITKSPGWDDATMLIALVCHPAISKYISHGSSVYSRATAPSSW